MVAVIMALVTARDALAKSYNIPTVKAYVDILDTRPARVLEKMGFTSLTEADYINPFYSTWWFNKWSNR